MKRVLAWAAAGAAAVAVLAVGGLFARNAWYDYQCRQRDLANLELRAADLRGQVEAARGAARRAREDMLAAALAGNPKAADECRARGAASDREADDCQRRLYLTETELRVFRETGTRPSPTTGTK